MRLLSLSLRGAVGIERGLGLDEIHIDFERFDSGIIAFVAKNGSGKSTILENLHPFRSLVSRQGALQNHFYLRDSHRILSFEMGGAFYTIKLLIDGQAGKQESYLFRDGEPLNDGKTTTYDAAVREIFGSEELFFRSLFRSQNAESITELKTSERKALFTELLGLAHIQAYHESAKAKVSAYSGEIDAYRAKIDGIREQSGDVATIREQHAIALRILPDYEDRLARAKAALRDAEEAERAARAALEAFAGLQEKRAEIETRRAEIEAKYKLAQAADGVLMHRHAQEIDALRSRIARADETIAKAANAEARLRELAEARETVQEQAEMKAQYDAAVAKLNEAKRELAEAKTSHSATVSKAEGALHIARNALRERSRAHDSTLAELRHRRDSIFDNITRAERDAELLGNVWCKDMEGESVCGLLANARRSRDLIASYRDEADDVQAKIDKLEDLDIMSTDEASNVAIAEENVRKANDAQMAAVQDAQQQIEAAQDDVDIVGYDAEAHSTAAATVRRLEAEGWERVQAEASAAATAKAEAEADIITTEARHDAETSEAENKRDEITRELESLTTELQVVIMKSEGKQQAEEAVKTAEGAVRSAASAVAWKEGDLGEARQNATRIATLLEAAEKAEAQIAEIAGQLDTALAAHGRWALLARACGKDGIQALELDAAGPNVSAIANQLLADTFGSQFQIAFETTRMSADGKKQLESFEIKVFSDGTEQTIENLSGGQRVWIEAAIAQAIAIYLRQKSGLDLRTSFLDESDGALDSDNAFRYLSMLRSAHALAGIHHTLLITHRQELLAHIPQQIRLVPGIGIEYVN